MISFVESMFDISTSFATVPLRYNFLKMRLEAVYLLHCQRK